MEVINEENTGEIEEAAVCEDADEDVEEEAAAAAAAVVEEEVGELEGRIIARSCSDSTNTSQSAHEQLSNALSNRPYRSFRCSIVFTTTTALLALVA